MLMRRMKRITASIMCLLLCFNLLMTDFVVRAEERGVNIETSDVQLNNAATSVKIDESTFPDANFRQYILDEIDLDENSILSNQEIYDAVILNCSDLDISDITGIKYFYNMFKLDCDNNNLENLDLSECVELELLYCEDNNLTSLDVSGCINLRDLRFGNNNLKMIDLSDCINLEYLSCGDNKLVELDVSKCSNLEHLSCGNNDFSELDVRNCLKLTYLYCSFSNKLTSLKVSGSVNLKSLAAQRTSLTSLNLSGCSVLEEVTCDNSNISVLNLNECIKLNHLSCSVNALKKLDLSDCLLLKYLDCRDNNLTSLDLTECIYDVQYYCDSNVKVVTNSNLICTTTEKVTNKNAYNFLVLNKLTGEPIPNIQWTVTGELVSHTVPTASAFSIEATLNNAGRKTVKVSADGYIANSITVDFALGSGKAIPIYLEPTKSNDDLSIEKLDVSTKEKDGNVSGTTNVLSTYKKWINTTTDTIVYITAYGAKDASGNSNVAKFELAQSDYTVIPKSDIIGTYNIYASHSISIDKLEEGKPIYIRAIDSKGNKGEWQTTNIKVYKGNKTSATVEIGEDIKVSFPKNIPVLGGKSFEISSWDDLPVTWSLSDDGSFMAGINLFEADASVEETNIKYNAMKFAKQAANDKFGAYYKKYKKQRNAALKKDGAWVHNSSIGGDIWGYIEGNIYDKTVSGKIVIEMTATTGSTTPYAIGTIPMVFVINIDGSIKGELEYSKTLDSKKFDLTEDFDLNGTVTAAIGVKVETGPGFGDLAYVTIGGGGTISTTQKWEKLNSTNKDYSVTSDLEIALSITAKFLFWKSSANLAQAKYQLYSSEAASLNNASPDMIDFTNEDSYVLDISDNSVSFNTTDSSTVPAFENETVLVNSANDDTKVFLENIGDTKMLFYTVKDTARSEINQNKLVYSLYDNESNTWSEAKAILDDGTADFYPYVISDGTDVYLSWVNLSAEMDVDTVTMVSSAAATEVVLAKYNAETDSFDTIYQTNNDMMDYAPTLGFTSDGVAMSWINNSNNNLFCDDDNNDIMLVNYAQSSVSEPILVKAGCRNVMSVVSGKLGTDTYIAVETDKDADYLTTDDRILTLYDADGNFVKTIEGGDSISDAIFVNFDGKDILVWHQDNTLYSIDSIDSTADYFISEEAVVANGYTISESTNQAFVTFLTTAENDCNVMSTYIYDKNKDIWSEQVGLSDTEANINMFDVVSDNEGFDAVYTDGSLKYADVELAQDLAFDYIEYDDYVLTDEGNKLDITATITNSGQRTVSGVEVKLINALGELVDSQTLDVTIPAGDTVDSDVKFSLPDTIGSAETYYVEISTTSGTETSAENNKQEISIGYTNLDLENLEATSFGNINTCTVYVKNNGPIATTGTAYLRHETEDGEAIKTIDIESLEPGESACVTIQINTDYVDWEGTHSLYYITLESDGVEKDTLMNSQTFYALKLACTDSEEVFTITSINEPEDVIFDNGTSVDDIITELPKYITVTTDKGDIDVEVSWNVDELSNGSYDPSLLTKQELSVTGNMIIPDSINAGELGTSVVLNVIVDGDKSIQSITFDKSKIELEVGSSDIIDITTIPDDGDVNTILWSSSDEKVVKVDSTGKITAIKEGNAIITACVGDNSEISANCTVTVTAPTTEEPKPDQPDQPKSYPTINTCYRTHIQSYGWEGNATDIKTWKSNGTMSGTSGKAKRLEGINIVVNSAEEGKDVDLGIQYTTHCQSYGWLPWSADGDMNGTEGEAKRLEAIKIQLTGADKDAYDVYYRVHAQSYGWLNWAKNGAPSGTAGYGKRLEGIQIVVVKKGEAFNQKMEGITSVRTESYIAKEGSSPIVNHEATSNKNPVIPGADTPNVTYRTHVQSFGWQGWKYNGQMSGTSGLAKRLEGININLTNKPYEGGIVYTTHVQKYGWKDGKPEDTTRASWKKNGEMSGTSGEAKRLEAICIDLTGEMGEKYDIYYRVHAQSFGWLGWACNGEESGTAGYAKRLEGIQIVLVPKGGAAPANNYGGVTSARAEAYIQK